MQIAIDGPAGAGKSTIARLLAQTLGAIYVDTGAMYRALTLKALREKIDLEDEAALQALAQRTRISFQEHTEGQRVICDKQDVTLQIRTPEVSTAVPRVSRHPKVRHIMVAMQQNLALQHDVVMDGRDIGEKVLPQADFKFYITASPEERARRRVKEWEQKGETVSYEQVLREIRERDEQDMNRSEGALKKLPDAREVDTTHLSVTEVAQVMKKMIGGC